MFMADSSGSRKSRLSNRRGGALLEIAVAMPMLILIAIGVIDYGRVYYTAITVSNAARAGAEFGSTSYYAYAFNSADQQSFAQLDGVNAALDSVRANTVCKCPDGSTVGCSTVCAGYGRARVFVTVRAYKRVTLFLRYPGLPTSINVSRSATFRAK
jgi:Flp pilus assembly protein TadG